MSIINPNEQVIGWLPPSPSGTTGSTINAAATWIAYSFVPRYAKTINEIRILCVTKTGTVTAGNITGSIYSDIPGTGPNAQIDINTNSPSYTTGTYVDFTGYATATTPGQMLHLVMKNLQGTPASNNITTQLLAANALPMMLPISTRYGWNKASSLDSGTTWATSLVAQSSLIRIKYSDGSYEGIPIKSVASSPVGVGIFGASELGTKFTLPSTWATVNVIGLTGWIRSITGTPTGNLRLRLYGGGTSTPTRLGTTNTIAVGSINAVNNSYFTAYFSTPIAVSPGTVLRAVMGTDGSDTNSNRFNSVDYTWDSDSNSQLLIPMGAVQTYSTDGTTFAETANVLNPFGLILDSSGGEFTVSAGGGGTFIAPAPVVIRSRTTY